MPWHKIVYLACLALAVVSLAAGLLLTGQALIALASLLPLAAMLLSARPASTWLAHIALVLFVGLAGAGAVLAAPPFLMLLSSIFALAAWDLALWGDTLKGSSSPQLTFLQGEHFKSLLIVAILGCLVVEAGQFIRVQVPFWIILCVVLIVLFSLDQILHKTRLR